MRHEILWQRTHGIELNQNALSGSEWGENEAASDKNSISWCVCVGEWRRVSMLTSIYFQKRQDDKFHRFWLGSCGKSLGLTWMEM